MKRPAPSPLTNGCVGFTISELLVVIAIITLLIVLAIPAGNIVRENGNATVCQANLRRLLVAWNQYSADHNGTICPTAETLVSPSGNGAMASVRWLGLLGPYLPGEIILRGWGDSGGTGTPAFSWIAGAKQDGDRVYGRQSTLDCPSNRKPIHYITNPDYGYNTLAFGNYQTVNFTSFRKMSAIPNPSQQLVFMDSKSTGNALYSDQLLPDNEATWAAPHRQRMHIGFADGHVESWERARLKEISQGLNRYQKAPWFAN